MVGLCLIAALAGPLLTRAQAGNDLGRSLSQLDERSDLSPADGGVGDEPEMAIAKWFAPAALDLSNSAHDPVGPAFLSLTHFANAAMAPYFSSGVLPRPGSARERLARSPILR